MFNISIENIVEGCVNTILEENSELLKYAQNNAPLSKSESKAINDRLDRLEEVLDGVKLLVEDCKHENQTLFEDKNEGDTISQEEYNAFFKRINMDL
jgi:ribosome assembly protein YihI (activator of Der GTPase)|tara:strand:- start:881 stop:1171 length:291 start_codon:yes stop_codon:yes gene_type:complete